VNFIPKELATIPPVQIAHRLIKPAGKIFRSTTFNKMIQQRFTIIDFPPACLRAVPPIIRPQRLCQLHPNAEIHHLKTLSQIQP